MSKYKCSIEYKFSFADKLWTPTYFLTIQNTDIDDIIVMYNLYLCKIILYMSLYLTNINLQLYY